MSYFSVTPVAAQDVGSAHASVRAVAPEIPPDLWTAFVANRREGELLALKGPDGSIYGIASYRIEACARLGCVMLIDNFWTVELSRSAPGRALLTATLRRIASDQGCAEVRQTIGCGGRPADDNHVLRNRLTLADPSSGVSFSKGPDCSCGNLRSLTATEMYPPR